MVNLSWDMDWPTYFPNRLDTSWWASLGHFLMADCQLGAHHAFVEQYKHLKIGSLPCSSSCFAGVCLHSSLCLLFYGQGHANNEVCGMTSILWNRGNDNVPAPEALWSIYVWIWTGPLTFQLDLTHLGGPVLATC